MKERPMKRKADKDAKIEDTQPKKPTLPGLTEETTLAELPEDILHRIIPLLGMKDRSSIAATCKRLYKLEETAGTSKVLEKWGETITINEGLKMGYGENAFVMKFITSPALGAVLQRILRASEPFNYVFVKLDLHDTILREVIDFIAASGAYDISLSHAVQGSTATINSELIGFLPWKMSIPDEQNSNLRLRNIRVDASDMRRLYEEARGSNFCNVHFSLPMNDAPAFGLEVLGIRNFSFLTAKKSTLTTSRRREKVYYTYHQHNHKFYMLDGPSETWIEKRSAKILDITIINSSDHRLHFVNTGDRRIPYMLPRADSIV